MWKLRDRMPQNAGRQEGNWVKMGVAEMLFGATSPAFFKKKKSPDQPRNCSNWGKVGQNWPVTEMHLLPTFTCIMSICTEVYEIWS